jgi:hypothetical protein
MAFSINAFFLTNTRIQLLLEVFVVLLGSTLANKMAVYANPSGLLYGSTPIKLTSNQAKLGARYPL